ncbi:N-acetylmuramoyl-L-alanine amidase lysozyme-like protein [Rhizobium phage RHph_I46]|uniref:N-acetylmuramoyl-L-alanine amidase n=1 Tax=Rhizobium phage RHph_I1_9 TaxID=2509729 RepID=A0A7S5UWM2_9CAUD|nr:amidase [Rhizobium phage RHph_I1_9]QIG69572.1 N-acetylmuramoyl-L-alanine amidase lysozyme-like protein [Rhizobium phage RHph_I46]QIG70853.1 N-acetylmuramoyl-L-alanine amidase lysozyme-like protein [Rhizobium phage RHph_I9]QIG73440.1 N-acetylmuramoyl-L-alanine amidase lysozyme-like protein [Rhizobium phage RHph_I1_9]QIG76192.1 N-acetylmuramoyl-L-alanine amidase lysozyme-like protein [Rhizobium phage RHph_I34]
MFKVDVGSGLLQGDEVAHVTTTKIGNGTNKRKYIVVHYTAGGDYDNDVRTLSFSSKQVSCHLVIGRTQGQIAQVGNFNQIQWHAGASQWEGINGLNSYSIGIEMTNPGWMEISADGKTAVTYYGKRYEVERDNLVIASHPALGSKRYAWLPYTQFQLQALQDIVEALKEAYPSIKEVVGHEQISPGRKQDPGIGIILSQKLLDKMNEVNFDGSDHFYEGTDDKAIENGEYKDEDQASGTYVVQTNGSALRVRKNYNAKSEVIGSLNNGQIVRVEKILDGFARIIGLKTGVVIDPNGGFTKFDGYASSSYLKKLG